MQYLSCSTIRCRPRNLSLEAAQPLEVLVLAGVYPCTPPSLALLYPFGSGMMAILGYQA